MDIEQFIQLLIQDLQGEFQAIATYTAYSASVVGIQRPELSELFSDEAHDELEHAQWFADNIAALGGIPEISITPIEPTDNYGVMLEILKEMENKTVANYSERADQAKAMGLHAIAVDIENILTDELDHFNALNMMSKDPQ